MTEQHVDDPDTVPPGQKAADPVDKVSARALLWTTVICVLGAVLGHVLLGLNYENAWLPWQPIAGASLALVAVTSFGGFYLASRRARVAITASFLLTFLVLLTYVVTISQIKDVADAPEGLVSDFRIVVQTIIGFYFGTEAIVAATKVMGVARSTDSTARDVRRADRDLV